MKIKFTKEEREQEIKDLKRLLKKCKYEVYTCVKHVSRSGMSRNINFYCFEKTKDGIQKHWLSYKIAGLCDYPLNNDDTLKVQGCGMDMCFSVVYNLGRVLFPKGDGKTITGRNGSKEPETDGGYLLNTKYL